MAGGNTNKTLRGLRTDTYQGDGGGGTTYSSPNVISMQMKGAGIRGSKEGDGHESPAVAMGTEFSYHQSQVGHEADEPRAETPPVHHSRPVSFLRGLLRFGFQMLPWFFRNDVSETSS